MFSRSILWIGAAMLLGTWAVMVQAVSDSHLRNRLREYGYASTVEEIRAAYHVEYGYRETRPADLFKAAVAAKVDTGDVWERVPILGNGVWGGLVDPISDLTAEAIHEYSRLNSVAIDLAYRAAEASDGHLIDQAHDSSYPEIEFGRFYRAVSRMLGLEVFRHIVLGDEAGAVEALIAQCAVADANRLESLLVSQYVRSATIGMVTGSVEILVNRSILSDKLLMRLDSALLSIESTVFEDMQKAVASDITYMPYPILYFLLDLYGVLPEGNVDTPTNIPSPFEDMLFVSGLGISDRVLKQFNAFELLLAEDDDSFTQPDGFYLWRDERFASLSLARALDAGLTGTSGGSGVVAQQLIAGIRTSRMLLALERYHRANQRYPESLDALVPEYLERLLIDTFSGLPLGYLRYDDRVVVYSYGRDRDDDGGQRDEETRREGDMPMELYKPEFRPLTGAKERKQ